MAKSKVLQGNLQETHLVKKPLPFVLMKKIPFSLGELRILDTYLSRINIRDPDSRTVTFTKTEFEELLELKQVRPDKLNERITAMHEKVATIPYFTKKGRAAVRNISLFSMSEFEKSDDTDEWEVKLCCSDHAKTHIFTAETAGYLRYMLKHSIKLKSRYSFLLYNYLLNNRFRGSWSVSLDELKIDVFRLDLIENPSYEEYKIFRRDVLDKAIKEVNEKTDIEFKHEPEKQKKRVVGIKFTLVKIPHDVPGISDFEQPMLDGFEELDEHDSEYEKNISLLQEACGNEFDEYEIDELLQIVVTKALPDEPNGVWIARYHYLAELYKRFKRYDAKSKIDNKFEYFKKMVVKEL